MPSILNCDSCGKEIKEIGWRSYPARVETGALVGTHEVDGAAQPIGEAHDLCEACVPAGHPLKERDAEQ